MKLPPYGKPLNDFLSSGHLFTNEFVYIYVGNRSWEEGKSSRPLRPLRTLILPPEYPATDYRWPVRDCDILIIETTPLTEEYMKNIVLTLYSYKAKSIISFSFIEQSNKFYQKEV